MDVMSIGYIAEALLAEALAVIPGAAAGGVRLPISGNKYAIGFTDHAAASGGNVSVRHGGEVYATSAEAIAYGTRLCANTAGKLRKSVASLTTNLTGATNNDLVYTAKGEFLGERGNLLSVVYVDPGGVSATASVQLRGTTIVVNLGRATSAVNTTADDLKTLLAANTAIAAIVDVADATDNDGSGLLAAMPETFLSGGDPVIAWAMEAAAAADIQFKVFSLLR